jgi:hypothetical protein
MKDKTNLKKLEQKDLELDVHEDQKGDPKPY